MTVFGPARRQRLRAACLVLVLFAASACGSRPIPLIAVQGTTIVLPLPTYSGYVGDMPFGSALAAIDRPDRQRGNLIVALCPLGQPSCASPQYYLDTVYVTAFVPDPASPASLSFPLISQAYGMQALYSAQALAMLYVPSEIPPAEYAVQVRRRPFGSGQGVGETALLDVDPGNIRIVARPAGVAAAPNPIEARFGTQSIPNGPDLLKFVPYPTVSVRLSDARSQDQWYWPASAEYEVLYPVDITIKGVFEENSPGRGSIVLVRDDPVTRTLRILMVDPRRCTPSLKIAYEWTAARTTAVLPSHFSVVDANTRTYNLAGQAHPSPPGSVVVRPNGILAGLACAEPPG